MPRKQSPIKSMRISVVRTTLGRFGSTHEVAQAYGVSDRTARRWLHNIREHQEPLKSEARAKEVLRSFKEKPPAEYFKGEKVAELSDTRVGKTFIREDYKIEAGARLPETAVTKDAYGYQIIAKGTSKGKHRTLATPFADTPEEAMQSARKLIKKYKFKGLKGKFYVRVVKYK